LNVSLALMEIKLPEPHDTRLLKVVTDKWPGLKSILGAFVLDRLYRLRAQGRLDADSLQKRTPLEINMALAAAAKDAPRHADLVEKISSIKKFQTPLSMYVHAEAIADTDPPAAIKNYIKAAMALQRGDDGDTALTPADLASRAARLAYSLYYKDKNYLDTARLTLEYYSQTAGDDIDAQLQYLYAEILTRSERTPAAHQLLQKIAAAGGKFSQQAAVDLIAHRIKESAFDPIARVRIAKQLEHMIEGPDKLDSTTARLKAVELYCNLQLEHRDPRSAQKVLDTLDRLDIAETGDFTLLAATALYKLDRHAEAIQLLADNTDHMTCAAAGGIYTMLAELLQQLDLHASQPAPAALTDPFTKLTAFCTNCADPQSKGHMQLLLIEFILLTPAPDKNTLAAVENTLTRLADQGLTDTTDYTRSKARLLMAQSQYAQAFELWSQLRAAEETAPPTTTKSIAWWRAKYYELFSFQKASQKNTQKVTHAVEILEATHQSIPNPWRQRIQILKTTDSPR
jgi:hypothetical protein